MNDAAPKTSVIICAFTEKRWDVFIRAVASVRHQEPPADEIIIVIDHNPELLAKAREFFPQQIVVENIQAQGLAGARNSGLAASSGRYVAFLDDDAVADPSWLKTLVERCEMPHVLGAGSKIDPLWPGARPRWFPEEFLWVVGCSYRGTPAALAPVRNLIGCSMCIRREVFSAVGEFHVGLGRVGSIPLGCEETELCIRARQHFRDASFVYEPAISVRHQVPPNRVTLAYFFRRCYAEGLSKYALTQLVSAADGLETERAYVLRTLPLGILRGLRRAFVRLDPAGGISAALIITGALVTGCGYLMGRYAVTTPPPIDAKHVPHYEAVSASPECGFDR